MVPPPNPTPHEAEALLLADDLDRRGEVVPASALRARVASTGIPDDLALWTLLQLLGFNAERITDSLRRVHAVIDATSIKVGA